MKKNTYSSSKNASLIFNYSERWKADQWVSQLFSDPGLEISKSDIATNDTEKSRLNQMITRICQTAEYGLVSEWYLFGYWTFIKICVLYRYNIWGRKIIKLIPTNDRVVTGSGNSVMLTDMPHLLRVRMLRVTVGGQNSRSNSAWNLNRVKTNLSKAVLTNFVQVFSNVRVGTYKHSNPT